MSCGVGRRRGSDLELLWLWHRLAAVAPIGPLAWEAPYADAALKSKKKKKKKKKKDIFICLVMHSPLACEILIDLRFRKNGSSG